jgi:hypothetical protein
MGNRTVRSGVTSLAIAGTILASTAAPALARAQTWTTVEHNVTLASEFFDDDICGARASTETLTNRVQVNHLTANDDGSFHFVDFETGMLLVDFVDPAIPDATFRRTETFNINLTPGGVVTISETFRQFDSQLTIRSTFHLTLVDGVPIVERETLFVDGCP